MRWRPLIAGLAISAICLVGFWELAEDLADSTAVAAFDASLSAAIQAWRSPLVTVAMVSVTSLGSVPIVLVGAVAGTRVLWRSGRRPEAGYAAAVVLLGGAVSTLLKGQVGRVRPPADSALVALPASFSFPSGHTMGSLCLAWVLAWLVAGSRVSRRARAALLACIALYPVAVGVSRVYLGVHWPSDVLASWLLGGAWIALATGAFLALGGDWPGRAARV